MNFSSVPKFLFPLLCLNAAGFAPTAEGLDKSTLDEKPYSQVDPSLYSNLKWRLVGPFRGGRALAVTGVPGEPNHFYFGAVAGGVWKTADGGQNCAKSSGNRSICWSARNCGRAYLQSPARSTTTIAALVNGVLALMLCIGLPVSALTTRYLPAGDHA